jgi:F0F1-type ATP synthase gamma subunit
MQITSAMKMVSAAKQENKMRLQQPLCRKINRVITKPSALDGDAGRVTQHNVK